MEAEMQQQQQMATQQQLLGQAGQLASSPLMDPTKNPEGIEQLGQALTGGQGEPPPPQET